MRTRPETMSNRALQRACGWWRRPDAVLQDGDGTTARDDGDDLHDLAAAELNGVDDEGIASERALAMFAGLKPLLERLRARPNCEVLAEVSIGYQPATGKSRIFRDEDGRPLLGLSRADRDARTEPGEYAGTIDVLMLFRDATGNVCAIELADHKTTWAGGEPQDATDQLLTYAAVAADAVGAKEALAYPIVCTPESSRLGDAIALDDIALEAEMSAIHDDLVADVSKAEPTPGPHCHKRYCKARASCPVTKDAIALALPNAEARPLAGYVPGSGIVGRSNEDMARIHLARKLLEEAVEAMKRDERAWLEREMVLDDPVSKESLRAQNPILHPDGSRTELVWSAPEKVVMTAKALEIIEGAGAQAAVKASMTWADLNRVLGEEKGEALRVALREAGCTKKNGFFKPTHKAAPKSSKKRPGSLIEQFDARAKALLADAEAIDTEGNGL